MAPDSQRRAETARILSSGKQQQWAIATKQCREFKDRCAKVLVVDELPYQGSNQTAKEVMKKNKKLHDVYVILDDGTEKPYRQKCSEPYNWVRVWVRREKDGSEDHLTCGASTRPMPLILQDFFFKREIAREYIGRTRLVELN